MKAILMSIKPKWCEKIFSGEKTIEVRKTAPKLEPPFKVYVYCTKARHKPNNWLYHLPNDRTLYYGANARDVSFVREEGDFRNGMVIGEFVCDRVDDYIYDYCDGVDIDDDSLLETCLEWDEINIYANGKKLHGLHITSPKRYDTPKELSEFKKGCNDMYDPQFGSYCGYCPHPCFLTRPPQSWMYVEEIEE